MKYIIPEIPPSLNKFAGRQNVWEYRMVKEDWKSLVFVYCRPKPSNVIKKAIVTIEYFFKTRTRHDPDNYSGKQIMDGLTSCGILEDDDFSRIELRLKGNYDKNNPRTEITIEEV